MWDDDASQGVGEALLQRHQDRIKERVDATGRPYPPNRDNRETGRLAVSFGLRITDRRATISNTAPHAAPVNAVTPIMGMSEAELDALEADDGVLIAEIERLEQGLP